MARSNREIRLIWCLWLSLSGSDGLFEQRIPLDMMFVAVPFGLSDGLFEQRIPLDMVFVAVPSGL